MTAVEQRRGPEIFPEVLVPFGREPGNGAARARWGVFFPPLGPAVFQATVHAGAVAVIVAKRLDATRLSHSKPACPSSMF